MTAHRIIHGDCRDEMPAHGPFDMIMADPPYGDTSLPWDKMVRGWEKVAASCLKPTGSMWVFGSLRFFMLAHRPLRAAGLRIAQEIVWEKHNGSSFHADRFKRVHELAVQVIRADAKWADIYNEVQTTPDATPRTVRRKKRPAHTGHIEASHYVSEDGGPRIRRSVIKMRSCHGHAIHETEKPVGLLEILIRTSCPPGGTVGDLFAGSGAAGEAAAIAGGNPKTARRALDFYPTPVEATRALLFAEGDRLRGKRIWEPCARGGAILRVLHEFGMRSIGTDIVADPANDVEGTDLFDIREALTQHVVTNMPFAIARRMVGHLWNDLRVDYMALLFKVQFLNCGKGAQLYRACPPTRRWDLTWRLDFTGGGNPTMDCVWLVWDRVDSVRDFGLLDMAGPVRPLADVDLFG